MQPGAVLLICVSSWASIPDSSESQARFTNRHEEQLLLLEDTRYEWDLRIGRLEALLHRLERIAEALVEIEPPVRRRAATVRVSVFTQIDVDILKTVFGTNADQVVSNICLIPLTSIPIVHDTLLMKLKQWCAMRYFLQLGWSQQEAPHWAGALDFKKRFIGRPGSTEEESGVENGGRASSGRQLGDRMNILIKLAGAANSFTSASAGESKAAA
ncbi:histone deacetylase complex subunit sin3 [Cystoisospora suis]|uniref:Histone deacetylase complex subunit sin3 n=1 Tax=Cystoisospora suis TaxID=483139 RepID=A0A2C6KH54_9APIC|nr:histone deacetylase complex subunit sin3 [Cystoisospora suis]